MLYLVGYGQNAHLWRPEGLRPASRRPSDSMCDADLLSRTDRQSGRADESMQEQCQLWGLVYLSIGPAPEPR